MTLRCPTSAILATGWTAFGSSQPFRSGNPLNGRQAGRNQAASRHILRRPTTEQQFKHFVDGRRRYFWSWHDLRILILTILLFKHFPSVAECCWSLAIIAFVMLRIAKPDFPTVPQVAAEDGGLLEQPRKLDPSVVITFVLILGSIVVQLISTLD